MPTTQIRTKKRKATSVPAPGAAKNKIKPAPGICIGNGVSAEERDTLIARAAYFRAEKRGFAPGCELQDWVEAEAEVVRLIAAA